MVLWRFPAWVTQMAKRGNTTGGFNKNSNYAMGKKNEDAALTAGNFYIQTWNPHTDAQA